MASSKKHRPAPLSAAVRLTVPGDWHLPPLTVRAGRSELTAGPVASSSTDHRYLDTGDLRLLAVGVTLSRRAGGEAPGWLLELPRPGGGASTVRLPLRGPSVAAPRQLSGLLRATLRGSRLATVARVHVERVVHPLVVQVPRDAAATADADGAEGDGALFAPDRAAVVVLELVDVLSTATLTAGGVAATGDGAAPVEVVVWRELELRPVGGELPVKDKHLGSFAQEVLDQLLASGADVVPAPEVPDAAGADDRDEDEEAGAVSAVPVPRPGDELRAVLARSTAEVPAAPAGAPAPTAGSPTGEVVAALLRARLEEVLAADRALRGEEEGALAVLTAAARRLDAALALVPAASDAEADAVSGSGAAPAAAPTADAAPGSSPAAPADPAVLRADLGAVLARLDAHADAVAVHAEVEALLRSEPPEQVLGPVAARTTLALDRADRAAASAAARALGDARYFAVLDGVEALVAGGPTGPGAPAKKLLPVHAADAHRRLADAVEALDGARDQQEHDALLLALRAALREATATARVLAPVLPEADRYADGLDEVEPLVRAAVVAGRTRVQLRQLGVQAHLAGENGYSYGRLDAIAQEHGELAAEAAEEAWEQASRARRRRWFD